MLKDLQNEISDIRKIVEPPDYPASCHHIIDGYDDRNNPSDGVYTIKPSEKYGPFNVVF